MESMEHDMSLIFRRVKYIMIIFDHPKILDLLDVLSLFCPWNGPKMGDLQPALISRVATLPIDINGLSKTWYEVPPQIY